MNIICNNCVGSRIYQQEKVRYNNPFTWCRIYTEDYIKLMNNFERIDFDNFKLIQKTNEIDESILFGVCIDNLVNVYYPHYKMDTVCKNSCEVRGVDVYSNDIGSYIRRKYRERIKRMKGNPIFVLARNFNLTKDDIVTILSERNKKFKLIIASEFDMDIKNEINVHYIHLKEGGFEGVKIANRIIKECDLL